MSNDNEAAAFVYPGNRTSLALGASPLSGIRYHALLPCPSTTTPPCALPMLLSELPVELLLDQVLPWLTLQSLAALTCTNKFFAVLCSDDTFWKLKLQRDYNFSLNADTARESGWKIIYRGIRKPAVYTWG